MRVRSLGAALGLLCVVSCSHVSLTPEGEGVAVLKADAVTGCKKVGTASASTKDQVWMFGRRQKAVDEELSSLGRNEAAKLGGDTIVPTSGTAGGKQSFDVYRCGM